jgi:SAM-dependent methyltransferase
MKHSDTILIVGCGNSNFSLELYDNGFTNIVNIDFSEVVIDRMKKANEVNRPMMQWLVMDMTSMTFDTNTFDVVIDKASMDALCVDEGDVWDPKDDVINSVHRMCTDISRILKPKGYFLSLSFAQPHFRTKYLNGSRTSENSRCIDNPYEIMKGQCDQYNWTLNYEKISKELGTFEFYLYVMEKGE